MQSVKKGMFLYPWDILDEGAQPLARRLADMGVEQVSLALVYHSGKLLLPHNPRRRMLMHASSRSYFPFDAEKYGRLYPLKGEPLHGDAGEFLNEGLSTFHQQGIRVCAWAVVFHAGRLARLAPDCAIQSFLGEPSPHCLCPSNDEVFAYGLTLLEDIARAGVDELHLESVDYAGFLHGAHHEMQAYADTKELERLMGLCFCPACMRRAEQAGIDAGALRAQVSAQAERFLRLEPLTPVEEALWNAYGHMRTERIAAFYKELRQKLRAAGLPTLIKPILWFAGASNPVDSGVDPALLADSVDGAIVAYPDSPEAVGSFLERVRALTPSHLQLTGGVRLMAPHTVDVRQVSAYRDAYVAQGIHQMIFYNYGMAPQPFLDAMAWEGTP